MHPEALAFLNTQRVSVIAIEMLDGSPHGATVHFAHREDPVTFIMLTESRYRKSEALHGRAASRATMVIGFEEGSSSKTLQMDGIMTLLPYEGVELKEIYLAKFPSVRTKLAEPADFFFTFTPTWWRYTDWTNPQGKTIYLSDGSVETKGDVKQLKVT